MIKLKLDSWHLDENQRKKIEKLNGFVDIKYLDKKRAYPLGMDFNIPCQNLVGYLQKKITNFHRKEIIAEIIIH